MIAYFLLGCLNGGAQVRPMQGESGRELVSQLQTLYSSLPVSRPAQNKLVKQLYSDWLDGRDSDKAKALLHTSYHALEKNDMALNIKWWYERERLTLDHSHETSGTKFLNYSGSLLFGFFVLQCII